jgi:hypothetical protein
MNFLLNQNDLILTNFNGRYAPIKIMRNSNNADDYICRTSEARQDYHSLNYGKYIVKNFGNISFTDFYTHYETLCPEFKTEIKEEFDFIVSLIDIERENNRSIPVLGHTKIDVYLNKIKQFPLS